MGNSNEAMSDTKKQQQDIVEFYKDWTIYWDNVRGNQAKQQPSSQADRHAAITDYRSPYVRLLEESLRFAGISAEEPEKWPKKVVDVGSGVGGAARHFAAKYGSQCVGINISPYQTERAKIVTAEEGLADMVSFECADAMEQPFADGQFDLVWCMGTAEHISDRKKFIDELARVTAPGGVIIVILTCHRELQPGEMSLRLWEKILVKLVCNACYFSLLCPSSDYASLMKSASLEDVKETIINDLYAPLCSYSTKAILSWKGITSMFCSGLKAVRGVCTVPLIITGYKTGVLNVSLISCQKPIK